MIFLVSSITSALVSTVNAGVGLSRLRRAGDGEAANGVILPGSGDR